MIYGFNRLKSLAHTHITPNRKQPNTTPHRIESMVSMSFSITSTRFAFVMQIPCSYQKRMNRSRDDTNEMAVFLSSKRCLILFECLLFIMTDFWWRFIEWSSWTFEKRWSSLDSNRHAFAHKNHIFLRIFDAFRLKNKRHIKITLILAQDRWIFWKNIVTL